MLYCIGLDVGFGVGIQVRYILIESVVEGVPCHRFGVAEDDEFHSCSGDGHVHASQVV